MKKAAPAKKPAAAAKKPAAKPVAKKTPAKPVAKKPAAKPVAKTAPKAAPAKKAPPKKPAPKPVAKPVAKKAPAKAVAKPVAKKPVAKAPAKVAPKAQPPVKAPVKPVPAAKPVAKLAPKAKTAPAPVAPPLAPPLPFGSNLPLPAPTTWSPAKRHAPLREKPLTAEELKAFRKLVEESGRRMLDNLNALTRDNLKRSNLDGEMVTDTSAHATHSADHGTDNFDREMALNLACGRQEELVLIREALHRIDEGTYGICEICGNPIGRARLKAKPYARLCIACKSEAERGVPKFRPLSKSAGMPNPGAVDSTERDENSPVDE
ncbi:MAG: TraR/DksA family transcriptional regulator [Kiritimatiellae bacterium]|nr:TraR/DksA family transcriptional regulator [Kiritimatiellia bacterium]